MMSGMIKSGELKSDGGVDVTSFVGKSRKRHSGDRAEQSENKSKYLTVVEGGYAYTYVVIGENFKVLIGKVAVAEEEKEKEEKGDAASASDRQGKINEYDARNAPYQDSQDFLACQKLLAEAKKEGLLPE